MDVYLAGNIFIEGALYFNGILISGNMTDKMDYTVVLLVIIVAILGLDFIRRLIVPKMSKF